jgi:hypothetical protein
MRGVPALPCELRRVGAGVAFASLRDGRALPLGTPWGATAIPGGRRRTCQIGALVTYDLTRCLVAQLEAYRF